MSFAKDEFDLLRSLRLSSVKEESQRSASEREALAKERHRVTDEAQYVGHVMQDKVIRMRKEFNIRGRIAKPSSYTRDSADRYGLFWFGQGKYEDDADDAVRRQCRQKQRPQLEVDTRGGVGHAERVPEAQRYLLWRPAEAPPRGTADAAADPARAPLASAFARSPAPAPRRRRPLFAPPWAEHYDTDATPRPPRTQRASHSVSHRIKTTSPGRAPLALPLPRGANGIDGVLQRARQSQALLLELQDQRLREDKETCKRATRAALDAQLEDNCRRALAQYEADMVHQFGPTMRHIIADEFGLLGPPRALPWESAGGDEGHSSAKGSDAAGEGRSVAHAKEAVRPRRERAETKDEKAHRARRAWLAAWEIHKHHQEQQQQQQQQRQEWRRERTGD